MEMVRIVMSIILGMAALLLLIAVPARGDEWGVVIITKVLGLVFLWLSVKMIGADKEEGIDEIERDI